jgi:hypothetical protein
MNDAQFDLSVKPSDSVRDVENQDGSVLLDIHQGICFSLNPVGAKIWQMLKTECSVGQITEHLSAECGVPREQVEQDVTDFVRALREKKLLKSVEPERKHKSTDWVSRLLGRFAS